MCEGEALVGIDSTDTSIDADDDSPRACQVSMSLELTGSAGSSASRDDRHALCEQMRDSTLIWNELVVRTLTD